MTADNPTPTPTPTPWRVSSSVIVADVPRNGMDTTAVAYCGDEIRHAGGLCYGDERDANARFIVRAANSHAAMLAALKAMLRCYVDGTGPHAGNNPTLRDKMAAIDAANAAIKLAEEG